VGSVTLASCEAPLLGESDVLVVGAGVSGLAAAISAARAGARTTLIERTALIGGVATSGLMASTTNHLFDGRGRQVVRGFCEEFLDRLAERGGASPAWKSPDVPQVPHDPEIFQLVAADLLAEAGVEVRLLTVFCQAMLDGKTLRGVFICDASGLGALRAAITVDTTGNADVAVAADVPMRRVERSGVSLEFRMGNVDLHQTHLYFKGHPEEYPGDLDIATNFLEFERNWLERGIFYIPHGGGARMTLVREAIDAGAFSPRAGTASGLDVFGMYALRGTDTVIINSNFFEVNPLDPQALARTHLEARQRCFDVAAFLRTHLPGFERGFVAATAPEIGVRVSRCIVGEHALTVAERDGGARFDDVVGMGSEVIKFRRPPDAFDIPYRILVPQQVDRLLVGGAKTVSTERPALIRGQAHGMTLGQAAGVAAALCALDDIEPPRLDVRHLQRHLLEQNVWLGDEARLRELGLISS
jgi:hypothetical protein